MSTLTPMHPNRRDAEQVRVLSGMGASSEFISKELNLSPTTLTTHYSQDLELGLEEANIRVARTFFDMATSGEHPQLTIAWMKMRARWSESNSSQQDDTESLESNLNEARDTLSNLLSRRPEVVEQLTQSVPTPTPTPTAKSA